MAQADQTIQNATFPTVRADINNNLAALFSDNSGATAPSPTVAFQDWIDTSGANPLWKKRNAANNAFITLGTIIGNTIAFEGTLPDQTGNAGKFLTTDGTVASFGVVPSSSVQVFTSSGTFVKPANGTVVLVHLWGGGGGGGRNQGASASAGGGGACIHRWFRLSELASTVAVTIGDGGLGRAVNGQGGVGGTSSFGALFSAFGGGGGGSNASTGGGGGGSLSAGALVTNGSGHGPTYTGGQGADGSDAANADFGGGGGGTGGQLGGTSIWGGGGGRGVSTNTVNQLGAVSLHGGNGGSGNNAGAGAVPGGGGGASRLSGVSSGPGARGECRIYIW